MKSQNQARSFSKLSASKVLVYALSLCAFTSCVTTPSMTVIERADGLSSAPRWTLLSESQSSDNSTRLFIGYLEVDGDSLKSSAFNMADEKALTEPTKHMVEEFLDQNQVGEDLQGSGSYGRRLMSATSGFRPPMPSLRIIRRYYEVVLVRTGVSADQVKLRVWSQSEASTTDYERAKQTFLRRISGDPEVKKILDDVSKRQIDKVISKDPPQDLSQATASSPVP